MQLVIEILIEEMNVINILILIGGKLEKCRQKKLI